MNSFYVGHGKFSLGRTSESTVTWTTVTQSSLWHRRP